MWNFSLLSALQSVEKCMGFVLQRWLVFLGVAFGLLLATLAGAGTAVGLGSFSSKPTLFANFGAVAGFAAFAAIYAKSRKSIHRSIRTPHLLLLVHLAQNGPVPEGWAQGAFARRLLTENGPDFNDLWQVRTLCRFALSLLPRFGNLAMPSTPWLAAVANKAAGWMSALNADLIIASLIATPIQDPWSHARSGILAQARNVPLLLKNRCYLTLLEALIWALSFALFLLAFNKIAANLPFDTGYWPLLFALIFGWHIKASFFEPVVQASMMQLTLEHPDSAETARAAEWLSTHSEAFRSIDARKNQ